MKNLPTKAATNHGGTILTGSDRIKVNGRRAARQGNHMSCPIHGENRIIGGSIRMTDGGVLLATMELSRRVTCN